MFEQMDKKIIAILCFKIFGLSANEFNGKTCLPSGYGTFLFLYMYFIILMTAQIRDYVCRLVYIVFIFFPEQ